MIYCLVLGVFFIVIGLAGSVTGGHSHALLGLGMNIYHNVLHLAAGFIALAAVAAGPRHAKLFCLELAAFSGLVALGGLQNLRIVTEGLNVQPADVWLYVGVALTALGFGLASPVPLKLCDAVDSAPIDRPPFTWA